MPGCLRAGPRLAVIAAKDVQQVPLAKTGGTIGDAVLVNQKGKCNACFFPEQLCVIAIAQADGCQLRPQVLKLDFVFAQLRNVLAAEDSTVVTEKHDNGRRLLPERSQAHFVAVRIRQRDSGERFAELVHHK